MNYSPSFLPFIPNSTKETIAVYFDGDNVCPGDASVILQEIKSYGDIVINRVYADWEVNPLKKWRDSASMNGIMPIQCGRLNGKNSTDIKLCVDLMKDLYTVPYISLFYIITSDSDYRHVLPEIKLKGKKCHVIGRSNANVALMAHADQYTKIEVLRADANVLEAKRRSNSKNSSLLSSATMEVHIDDTATTNNKQAIKSNTQEGDSDTNGDSDSNDDVPQVVPSNNSQLYTRKMFLGELDRAMEGKTKLLLSEYREILVRKFKFDQREYGKRKFHKFMNDWLLIGTNQYEVNSDSTAVRKKS